MSEVNAKDAEMGISTRDPKGELPAAMQKVCGVCGDRALGFNFNAISCESCKAFFRRNAVASKEFKCPFTNTCKITAVTRRFCQKCRLEKCFAIGMVKEYIMSENDKAEKRKKIEENRAKKRTCDPSEELVSSSKHLKRRDDSDYASPETSHGNSPIVNDRSPSMLQYDILNSTTCSPSGPINSPLSSEVDGQADSPYPLYGHQQYSPYQHPLFPNPKTPQSQDPNVTPDSRQYNLEESHQKGNTVYLRSILSTKEAGGIIHETCEATLPPHEATTPTPSASHENVDKARDILEDVERIPIEPNSIESILCEAIKLEFESYSGVSRGHGCSRELNEVERAKLNELIVANKALHAPLDIDITSLMVEGAAQLKDGQHDPALLAIVNLTAVAIRRLIKMAKKINAFKNMCEADQVALLKGGCIEMMVLRSAISHDDAKNIWRIPHREEGQSNIKTDVLKLAKGNVYHAYSAFVRSFETHVRTDENIILIMSAIVLFTPERACVVHRDVVKLERNSYYYLLRRYLESVYPGCEAKSIFLKLIQKVMELHRLSEEVIGVYLDVNPIDPLLMEIFDLKQHTT